ncbi:hypothetical protein IE980_09100 [Klebsiella pneumoniae]|uniref:Uncharacterized protein n=1 Tax=Klebsiella pneumoniae TaxID=573 RepID=A0A927HXE4_KLEPN|nr:hypothetical protein [Klebsiella pneumoniae]
MRLLFYRQLGDPSRRRVYRCSEAQLGENNPTYGALAGILAAPDNYLNTRSGIGSYVDYPLTVDKYIASERILQGTEPYPQAPRIKNLE